MQIVSWDRILACYVHVCMSVSETWVSTLNNIFQWRVHLKSSHSGFKKARNNTQTLPLIPPNCTSKVLENEVQLYADGCLSPLARRPPCCFLSQGRWQGLIEPNSPSCPSQITTKHLISNPSPSLSLSCFAPLLCFNTLVLLGWQGGARKESLRKRWRDARKAHAEKVRKGRLDGKKVIGKDEKWYS